MQNNEKSVIYNSISSNLKHCLQRTSKHLSPFKDTNSFYLELLDVKLQDIKRKRQLLIDGSFINNRKLDTDIYIFQLLKKYPEESKRVINEIYKDFSPEVKIKLINKIDQLDLI